MRIKIYQINFDRDTARAKFMGLGQLKDDVDSSSYDEVFSGDVDCGNLEDVFARFNTEGHPLHRGHSLSVSDVVLTENGAFFCDTIGFKEIDFDESKAHKPGNLLQIVYVEPNRPPFISEAGNDLKSLQRAVGGYIEAIYLGDGTILVGNEDAKFNGMEGNRRLGDSIIAGPFFIVGEEPGFVAKLAGCFTENQTDEQLIAEVNAAFGTNIDPEDFSAIMNYANHQLVEVAKSQLGNVGGEPYWSWYGFGGRVEWCACFVSWCANQCGYIDRGIIPKFAGCGTGVDWFKAREQWLNGSAVPEPGNIIFFDWVEDGAQDGNSDHVGIVEKVEGGRVYTIEGNSGDACQRNSYPVGNYQILGYGTPNLF